MFVGLLLHSLTLINHITHTSYKLEEDLAAARNLSHQLKEDEAAAQRLLQQRQDELQRTCRCSTRAVSGGRAFNAVLQAARRC